MLEKWTNTSLPPSREMKPKPFSALKNFTVPVAIAFSFNKRAVVDGRTTTLSPRRPLRLLGCVLGREEQRLDGLVEDVRDLERKWQAGVITTGLDCVDRLARDVETVGQVRLTPTSGSAQLA